MASPALSHDTGGLNGFYGSLAATRSFIHSRRASQSPGIWVEGL